MAREGISRARAEAARAAESTAKLQLEVATQRERAALAEKAFLELQERIRPRSISAEQRTRLITFLSKSPKGRVDIMCVLGDGEGLAFAEQVDSIFKASGWITSGVSQSAFSGRPIGFMLRVRNVRAAPPYAAALQQAFTDAGIPLPGFEQTDLKEGTVQLLIGNKL